MGVEAGVGARGTQPELLTTGRPNSGEAEDRSSQQTERRFRRARAWEEGFRGGRSEGDLRQLGAMPQSSDGKMGWLEMPRAGKAGRPGSFRLWGGWTPRCPGLGCIRWVHGPPGHPRSPWRCATLASFVEGRVRGQGAGSFPKESSAQQDTERPGWGVWGWRQQSLCWNPAWPPRAGQVQLLLDRQNGEGSSPFTLVASRQGAGFPVSSYLTLFGHWESDLVVLGSFRAFRCPSFTSSTWPGWALDVQEPVGLVSDGLWGPDLGGGMLRPSPGGGHRRRSPPGEPWRRGLCSVQLRTSAASSSTLCGAPSWVTGADYVLVWDSCHHQQGC